MEMPAKQSSSLQQKLGLQLRSMRRDPLLVLWGLWILLDPIYVFNSGLPQPGDLLILLLAPLALARWNGRLSLRSAGAVRALVWFVGYAIASAILWSVLEGAWTIETKRGFAMAPIFYIFDAIVFLVVLVMYERYQVRFVTLTVRLILISVCFQFVMTFIYSRGGSLRMYGLFNSSNQLGYFAILTASILLLAQRASRMSTVWILVGQLCAAYLALLSASRAALISAALLMMAAVLDRLRAVLAIGLVAAFLIFVANPFESAIERSRTRIATDQHLGLLEERGYDRMVDHPEYLILGAGEGGYIRFKETSAIGSHELHSSAGTLVFCYGIVGTALFCVFLLRVMRGATMRRVLLLLPPAAYALSHQGLRFTMFWVLLALVVMLNDFDRRARSPAEVQR